MSARKRHVVKNAEGKYMAWDWGMSWTADPLAAAFYTKAKAAEIVASFGGKGAQSGGNGFVVEEIEVSLIEVTADVKAALDQCRGLVARGNNLALRVNVLRRALDQSWNTRDEDGRDFREGMRDVRRDLNAALAADEEISRRLP